MPNIRVLVREHPVRTVIVATSEDALIFQHSLGESVGNAIPADHDTQRCLVEFASLSSIDLKSYRTLGTGYGTLGLVTLDRDVFVCIVTRSSGAATVRPGETVRRIEDVDFYCLNRSEYESALYSTETSFANEDTNSIAGAESKPGVTENPFQALKKLLNDGSFYYSLDFNLTDRLQDRSDKSTAFDIDTLNKDVLWNAYMIQPLLVFRSHLSPQEKQHLDSSQILTCVIRGFCGTLAIPATISILSTVQRTNLPSMLTLISRLSSRRAGTRFNARGIDDDGNVANFVETETILWIPPGIAFSYVQIRGSVPIFWEQATGFLPGQQKIEVARSIEATQHAFDKHIETLELQYGAVHVINLLSELRPGEVELSTRFREHIRRNIMGHKVDSKSPTDHSLLQTTEFDFHAEARGPLGYGAANEVKHELLHSLNGFAYFLSEKNSNSGLVKDGPGTTSVILQQEGVFRTNCLDCLDRTNLVQTIISSMALESFLLQQNRALSSDIHLRHSTLWADNGDALSKIYAGTGALKSSYTRHGKMSLAGALADARKTATRLYINNFSDKARQRTIDLLLGRLPDQSPVHLYDPINDSISRELNRRASEYTSAKSINIWTGTFNVNGRVQGPGIDLGPWLFPETNEEYPDPTIFAVGFQEIVTLSPQQIMSTDPTTRKSWEYAVMNCLNTRAALRESPKYVLLRSGQLVGAALMIYVREDVLGDVKNVEGSVKKTGLSGVAGNKGGCAIRFEYSNTKLCFVTAHLAAGFANYDERNNDYNTICRGLRFQRNQAIEDHDAVIWLGDFNYRIGLPNQTVRDLVQQNNYQKLYANDQLNLQMLAGRAFQFYSEGLVDFPPTYKYDIGKDTYDTSEKARIPAWCDRILWKGADLRQLKYDVSNLRLSDHRPVWAWFTCTISVVDETRKETLRHTLHGQWRGNSQVLETQRQPMHRRKNDVIALEPNFTGLPPPSSDHRKWWLDSGCPVKSSIGPPASGFVINAQRTTNPFAPKGGPDWVSAATPQTKCAGSDSTVSTKPPVPPRSVTAPVASRNPGLRSLKIEESSHKNGPPIPPKPSSLGSKQNSRSDQPLSAGPRHRGSVTLLKAGGRSGFLEGEPFSRSSEWPSTEPHMTGRHSNNVPGQSKKILMTKGLLDDNAGDEISWTPLIPQR
ncbi:SacI homology domain-containing protein [Aspergillus karnatakaensis]|uniref:SacI domain and endonuclease/exonuclease/phosphatase family protein n=1 Tax=Aspergillus karnatakaensis TaxID=1810916 RepID=UPI003CCD1AE6